MAIRFDNTADYLSRGSNLVDYNSPYTTMFWLYITTDLNAYGHFWALCATAPPDVSNNYQNSDFIGVSGDGTTLRLGAVIGGTSAYPEGTSLSTGTWYHIAVRRTSTTLLEVLLNGVVNATDTTSISGRASVAGELVSHLHGSFEYNGRMAYFIQYSAALTDAEIRAQMRAAYPLRVANLHKFTPMFKGATERLLDVIHGYNWTSNGTLTDEDPPTLALLSTPQRRTFQTAAAAGAIVGSSAGGATQSGALTGTGALVGTSAGSATQTGALAGKGDVSGTSAGISTPTATLAGIGACAGSSAGTSTATGALDQGAILGSSAGTASVSASITGSGALAGSSAGTASQTGLILGTGGISGSAAGSCTVSLSRDGEASGTSAGTSTVTAVPTGIGALSGSSAGIASNSCNLTGNISGIGNCSGTVTVGASLGGLGSLSGTLIGLAELTAILLGKGALNGSAAGLATCSLQNGDTVISPTPGNVDDTSRGFGLIKINSTPYSNVRFG